MIAFLAFMVGAAIGCVVMMLVMHPRRTQFDAEKAAFEEARRKFVVEADAQAAMKLRLGEAKQVLDLREREFADKAALRVTLEQLMKENGLLKADLRNFGVAVRKQKLDGAAAAIERRFLKERSDEVAKLYLQVTEKAVAKAISANNYTSCRDRLAKVIGQVRKIGFVVTDADETRLMDQLKHDFEMEVRASLQKEEQARIKEQMREEEKIRREAEREKMEKEREAAKARKAAALAEEEKRRAMEEAKRVTEQQVMLQEMLRLAEEKGAKEMEVAEMRKQIGELAILKEQAEAHADDAEARAMAAESAAVGAIADAMKAVSNAQLTRAGHVYVISNFGSFGKGVFKVGSTRRSDPDDRIRELGDASVPFPFDVHAMIKCEDAPSLENALHRGLAKARMNRVNPRKEFFRTDLEVIVEIVKSQHGCTVDFFMDAEAAEWKQSQEMSEGDAEYIESVFEKEGVVTTEMEP